MKRNDIFHRDDICRRREILLARIGVVITLIAGLFATGQIITIVHRAIMTGDVAKLTEQYVFMALLAVLLYGNFVYLLMRIGYYKRLLRHRGEDASELEVFTDKKAPTLTILIPSYKEATRVVRQSLLSAALQNYPDRDVVLLIDDPPDPSSPEDLASLNATRTLVRELNDQFAEQRYVLEKDIERFAARTKRPWMQRDEGRSLAQLYNRTAAWFEHQFNWYIMHDHTDAFSANLTLDQRAKKFRSEAILWERRAQDDDCPISLCDLERAYRTLAYVFRVQVSSFERKRYDNLSHEPNKAMNLNSYIELIGKRWSEVQGPGGTVHLVEARDHESARTVRDVDYLVTLDADSILDPDYARRLTYYMESEGNERVAVAQTPYSALPGAPGMLERIAGATTDMQYIIHQGFTQYGATFWVGANALLRKKALDDIRTAEIERGHVVARYIQDRTVIEDTESSVDLVARGWSLHNYPERLSYSATPDDFGSLLIQRMRWANGGLIILPKLLRYLLNRSTSMRAWREGFARVHYLTSIACVNVAMLLMFFYPFEENLRSIWIPLTAIPYWFLYGRDLVHAGYSVGDLLRVGSLNLMLIPVNLGGVIKSIQQGMTGAKIPFSRTPKIQDRTLAPAFYVIIQYVILAYGLFIVSADLLHARWLHAFFAGVMAAGYTYAVWSLIGLGDAKDSVAAWWHRSKEQSDDFTSHDDQSADGANGEPFYGSESAA